jgi:hypothetical protein
VSIDHNQSLDSLGLTVYKTNFTLPDHQQVSVFLNPHSGRPNTQWWLASASPESLYRGSRLVSAYFPQTRTTTPCGHPILDYVPFAKEIDPYIRSTMKTFARLEASRLLSQTSVPRRVTIAASHNTYSWRQQQSRGFNGSQRLLVVKPYLLADIGEGEHTRRL